MPRVMSTILVIVMGAGCGANVTDTGGLPNTTTSDTRSRCVAVRRGVLHAIASGLTVQGGSLSKGAAVKSEDFEKVWFVAAEIDGAGGLEGTGEIGVWATNADPSRGPSGSIFSVDGFAKEFSDWGDGSTTDATLSMSDDGAQEAVECL